MSLRLRLTLLYTSLLGGVLLLVGALVYGMVSRVLVTQIDEQLSESATQLVERLRVNASGQYDPRAVADFQPAENLLFQVWGTDGHLQLARPPSYRQPLSQSGYGMGEPYFSDETLSEGRMRVLVVPLRTERGPAGLLQVGLSLSLVDVAQRTLAFVLTLLIVAAMLLAWWLIWWVTGRALAPLQTVTEVATQITEAQDLSRRIALPARSDLEVRQLIQAFNQTMERLEQLFQSQRRFMADVSHELRTPLTVIKGEVGLMRKFGELDQESLASIDTEVDRLTRMVGDLLLLAQAESGRLPLDMRPVDLDTVLLEVFQQMSTLVGDQLHLQISSIDQVEVRGDRDRLKQVLLNLVGNAVKYTPRGGDVSIGLEKYQGEARITVKDTGPGISAEDLPHIFERFYRAERSRKREKGSTGFGLGLSIAYWIVQNHGGTVEVESRERVGTTFTVRLPLPEPEAEEARPGSTAGSPGELISKSTG